MADRKDSLGLWQLATSDNLFVPKPLGWILKIWYSVNLQLAKECGESWNSRESVANEVLKL